MAATTADHTIKPQESARVPTSKTWDMAFCLHIAAGRFGSPAGIAFLPQSYLPFLVAKKIEPSAQSTSLPDNQQIRG